MSGGASCQALFDDMNQLVPAERLGKDGVDAQNTHTLTAAVVDLRLRRGSGREVVAAMPPDVPVIIFSGVPSESAELERLRPHTRLIEKPYSLVSLVQALEEMVAESSSQNLHS